ncbi:MAG: NAD-dependent epimerase/dehydratase family protein [Terracidiphilus sp.]|jgi:nucleoside-diphosphate-sugar epimerase
MITILGAGGAIGNELVRLLEARKETFRLVGRKPIARPGAAETVAADLSVKDQCAGAVAGSSTVYLLAGLKYDHRIWAELWPQIMANAIEACKQAGARLVFFDNVYMYGRVTDEMTEETPFQPCSKKGEIRARVASALIREWQAGNLTAMIVRAADFYGPNAKTGIPNTLVFDPMCKKQKAMCLVDDSMPHSYSYTPDAAGALVRLAGDDSAWNQTWHVPTAPNPPTGREFIEKAAEAMGVPAKARVLSRTAIRVFGLFNPVVGELHEMLYQNDSPYLFDSSKYERAYGIAGTPYAEGVRATAVSYRNAS